MGLSSASFAWNNVGHMVVAEITYKNLSDAERTQIAEILKEHPHYKVFLTADVPKGVNEDEWAFLKAATWPDWVRPSRAGDKQYKDPKITKFNRPTWHYMNDPFVLEAKSDTTQPATKPVAASQPTTKEVNILEALADNRAILADTTAPAADRAVALCWVLHLTGDLHQPLHAASMISARFPQGDKGGNDQAVNTGAGVLNLHKVWDDLLGTAQNYTAVSFMAGDVLRDPRCDVQKHDDYRKHQTPAEWAEESHQLAVSLVYLEGNLSTAVMSDYQSKKIADTEVPGLPTMYLENARDVARVRVALAGERLADVLKAAMKK